MKNFGIIGIVSIEMLRLYPYALFRPISYIGSSLAEWKSLQQLEGVIPRQIIPHEIRSGFLSSIELLKLAAEAIGMPTTVAVISSGYDDATKELLDNQFLPRHSLQRIIIYGEKVLDVFISEADTRAFIALSPGHTSYLNSAKPLFGDEVDDAFPVARDEIADAGRCRATGLWTACVMHLMRAVEEPLNALSSWAGTDAGGNWNKSLNQIESYL